MTTTRRTDKWRAANPEKVHEINIRAGRKYYAKNRAKQKAKTMKWRRANIDKWNSYMTAYRDRDRKFYNDYQRQHRDKTRAEVIAGYGGRCVRCGTTEKLEIDHVNGDGWRERADSEKRVVGYMLLALIKRNGYPKDYQLLCRTCNKEKAMRQCSFCGHECPCGIQRRDVVSGVA